MVKNSIQGVAKLTYSKSGAYREKSQESRKNKIKNTGGGSLQRYMDLKVQTFYHVFFK
jgi:hypothetical protein